jgi:hypothetical protein
MPTGAGIASSMTGSRWYSSGNRRDVSLEHSGVRLDVLLASLLIDRVQGEGETEGHHVITPLQRIGGEA